MVFFSFLMKCVEKHNKVSLVKAAKDTVNVTANFNPDFIKILTLDGKVMYSNIVDPMVRDFQVPVNFTHGIYIVQMGMGNITMFTQKLIVFR